MTRIHVGNVAEFADGTRKRVQVESSEVIVLQWGETFHAVENRCPHMGGPVGEGRILGCVKGIVDEERRYVGDRFEEGEPHLICPWHGVEYDLATGVGVPDPRMSLRKYPVAVESQEVYLDA